MTVKKASVTESSDESVKKAIESIKKAPRKPAAKKPKETTSETPVLQKETKTSHEKKEPKAKAGKEKATQKEHPSAYEEPVQPVMNIGLVGHVDHGKTTLTERLSGKWTDTHSEEIKRGITIRLGYADTVFRKCPECEGDLAFTTKKICPEHQCATEPILKISFVDAPGHESLMATMLSGATIMDGALLLVAANELCPQPQTREHLMALEISGIEHVVVVQNKIDLVNKERALRNYQQIKAFLKGTKFEEAPIVPISAQRGVNIDLLIRTMIDTFHVPVRDSKAEPLMVVARSFDVNKPGTKAEQLKGGVLGGAIKQGVLKVGARIELRPGRIVEEANRIKAKPIFATIESIVTGGKEVFEASPGGSLALLTSLDHSIVRADSLTGNVVGLPGNLPPIWDTLVLDTRLLERVVGSAEDLKVNPLVHNEILMLNVNSAATVGIVTDLAKHRVTCKLKKPVCAAVGARVTISRRVGTRFRLIGYGTILEPKK
jgi:translation initiation factor 2 subunit 3